MIGSSYCLVRVTPAIKIYVQHSDRAPERRAGEFFDLFKIFNFALKAIFDSTTPKQYTFKPDTTVYGYFAIKIYVQHFW